MRRVFVLSLVVSFVMVVGCSSKGASGADADAGDASIAWVDAGGAWEPDANGMLGDEPPVDAAKAIDDAGGYPLCDGGSMPVDRFVTGVVSFDAGPCSGFGANELPTIVEGPPVGGGPDQGGLDVVSLGNGGSIVVSFAPNAIVDGPGVDFVVFENAFYDQGDTSKVFAEPGEVSVSDDGATWTTFPCANVAPFAGCAGTHPVLSSPGNCVSPLDPSVAGGDAFDLASIGVAHAKYVRVVDTQAHAESCDPDAGSALRTNGFDLDAVAIVNAESAN